MQKEHFIEVFYLNIVNYVLMPWKKPNQENTAAGLVGMESNKTPKN
jgi:hypothetical protein